MKKAKLLVEVFPFLKEILSFKDEDLYVPKGDIPERGKIIEGAFLDDSEKAVFTWLVKEKERLAKIVKEASNKREKGGECPCIKHTLAELSHDNEWAKSRARTSIIEQVFMGMLMDKHKLWASKGGLAICEGFQIAELPEEDTKSAGGIVVVSVPMF